jgi:hypothetical protein
MGVTLDLGVSESTVVFRGNSIEFPAGEKIEVEKLKKIKKREVCIVRGGELERVAVFAGGKYYQLVSVGPADAPTLEISGTHMHRIKNITPWQDSTQKVRALRVFRGAKVLDIGTGLGYTAILSAKFGASLVLTIEKDEHVLRMAEVNPWSRGLADERISIALADAAELVGELDGSSFDRILHDPPRFFLAGELYGLEFYRQLFKVLRSGGRLFHYVGAPGERRRKHIAGGVSKRLKEAGFTRPKRRLLGLVVEK